MLTIKKPLATLSIEELNGLEESVVKEYLMEHSDTLSILPQMEQEEKKQLVRVYNKLKQDVVIVNKYSSFIHQLFAVYFTFILPLCNRKKETKSLLRRRRKRASSLLLMMGTFVWRTQA